MNWKWMTLFMLVVAVSGRAGAKNEFRAFTSKDGRALEAKIVKHDPRTGKVTLELRNGRRSTVDVAVFMEEDQARIRDWYLSLQMFSPAKLSVKIDKKTADSGRFHGGEAGWHTHYPGVDFEDIAFELFIDNRSNVELKDVLVEYAILTGSERREQKGKSELRELDSGNGSGWFSVEQGDWEEDEKLYDTRGEWKIARLLPKKKAQHDTKSVKLRDGTFSWKDTPQLKKRDYLVHEVKDELRGFIVRISIPLASGGFARKAYSYPSDFLAKVSVDWEKHGRSHPSEVMIPDSAAGAAVARQNSGKAEYALAMDYQSGRNGKTKDIHKAIELFEKSGDLGTPKSYCLVGDIYERGNEVPRDLIKAVAYYEKSFAAGWSSGAAGLGELYLKGGDGIEKDEVLALEWFEKGAATEDKNCLRELAWYYGANETAAKRDGKKAAAYADRLMAQGVSYFLYTGAAAAAYAEGGRFDDAVKIQTEVVDFINKQYPEQKHAEYRSQFQRNLERFQRGESLPTKR